MSYTYERRGTRGCWLEAKLGDCVAGTTGRSAGMFVRGTAVLVAVARSTAGMARQMTYPEPAREKRSACDAEISGDGLNSMLDRIQLFNY